MRTYPYSEDICSHLQGTSVHGVACVGNCRVGVGRLDRQLDNCLSAQVSFEVMRYAYGGVYLRS